MNGSCENKLQEALHRSFHRYASHTVMLVEDTSVSYHHLHCRAFSIAEHLKRNGVCPGSVIGVHTQPSVDTYAAMLSCLMYGYVCVPISFLNSTMRNQYIIERSGVQIVLSSAWVADGVRNLHYDEVNDVLCDEEIEPLPCQDFHQTALILFTSGSTGTPKGVQLTYHNLWSYYKHFTENCSFSHKDVIMQMFDLSFDFSLQHYLTAWLYGATLVPLMYHQIKYLEVIRLLKKYKITHSGLPPSFVRFCKKYEQELLFPHMRYVVMSSEPLLLEDIAILKKIFPNARIDNQYGPTECTVTVTSYNHLEREDPIIHRHNVISVGKPYAGNRIFILDENNAILREGEKGEIAIVSDQCSEKGYVQDESLTAEKFITLSYEGACYRAYKTGDLGILCSDGHILYCGRADFQMKIQGYRIEPAELEYYFQHLYPRHRVVALQNQTQAPEDFYYVISFEPDFDVQRAEERLKELLPRQFQSFKIIMVDDIPLNNNGKVDRKALQEMILHVKK